MADEGMHTELFYGSGDSLLAIFTSASCAINNSDPTASFQSPQQNSTLVTTVC